MLSGRLPRKSLVRRSLVRQSLGVPRFAEVLSGGTASITLGAVTLSAAGTVTTTSTMPNFQAVGSLASGTGDVTCVWPAHAENDIGLMFVECAAGETVSLGTANGFAAIGSDTPQTSAGGSGGSRLYCFWARASSGAMASPVITDPGNHACAVIITVRGCITTGNPWDVISGAASAGVEGTATVPGDTTTGVNRLVVVGIATPTDSDVDQLSGWANADLANLTERFNESTATPGNGGGIGIVTGEKAVAGAYGNTTATIDTDSNWAGIAIALKPA